MIGRLLVAVPLLIAGALAVCLIVLMLTGRERVWTTLYGKADLGPAQFETLVRPAKPNQYLVCPDKYCQFTVPDRISKAYPVAPDLLLSYFAETVADLETVEVVNEPAPDDFRFIDRTRFFRFPDTISVDVVEGESGSSMLAVFSRSQIGYSDLGANKQRVEALLMALEKRLAALP